MAKHETSTIYQWPADTTALVNRIEIVRQKNGRAVAYIHANEDPARKAERLEVRAALRLKGWGTLSDNRENRFVLRVNGFTDNADLLAALNAAGATKGTPQANTRIAEKERPQGPVDAIRTNSLRASGIAYSLGNLVYLASGILRNREKGESHYKQIKSAVTWGAGDLLVAAIGGKDDGRQLNSLLTKLKHHYQNEGIDIPVTATIHSETSEKNRSFGSAIYDFAHKYLNQLKCATEVVAAYYYFGAGKEQGNKWKQRTALIFGTGFGASLLIPEKKIDPEQYAAAGTVERLWMKIRSNPLSLGGLSGYSNTILTSYGAFDEGRRFNKPEKYPTLPNPTTGKITPPSKYYKLDYAAPAVMFFGNGLYAASKKTTGGDIRTDAMIGDVYSVASQIINKLPECERERALESTAKFLGERPEVRDTKEQVRQRLAQTIEIQRQNPWFEPSLTTILPTPTAPTPTTMHATTPSAQLSSDVSHVGKGIETVNNTQLEVAAKAF